MKTNSKTQAQEVKNSKKENLEKSVNELVNQKKAKVEKSKAILNKEEKPNTEIKLKGVKAKVKKEKTKRDEIVSITKKKAEANLVEEVVTKREVKYIYPEDVNDTLSRKKFRQQVRNKIHQLELTMLRIKDKESKEFKKAKKEYDAFKAKNIKESVAI